MIYSRIKEDAKTISASQAKNKNMNLIDLTYKHKIKDITYNPEEVTEDIAYVEITGSKMGGPESVKQALAKGAKLIFTGSQDIFNEFYKLTSIELVENPRKTLAELATLFYPWSPDNLIAVTGTNGKSSVVHYIANLLYLKNIKSSSIGTLGSKTYDPETKTEDTRNVGLTTPDSISFNKELNWLKTKEYDYCAIEASSIGLDQFRLYGRKFKVAGFTSFTRDHLDYHKTMESYLESKLRLFSEYMDKDSIAIINNEIEVLPTIIKFLEKHKRKYLTYGLEGDISYKIIDHSLDGFIFSLKYQNKEYHFESSIISKCQIANIVLSIASLVCCGFELEAIEPYVKDLKAPPGRIERISDSGQGARIFVDYAHTPDALENILKEMKEVTSANSSKLIVVFGCGGNRDKTKRPLMGEIAANNADIVIVTDDNPRLEDPADIRKEVLSGCPVINGIEFFEIGDRKEAISFAISKMTPNDILVIAGKGHEDYQIIGETKTKFSDREVALGVIASYS